jgi:cellulose synthase/poly-beta-1,6-N-acetylglucosamine synthase-like glycosyltransferase
LNRHHFEFKAMGTKDFLMSDSSPDNQLNEGPILPRVSVIVCAYTLDRWELLNESLQSVVRQDMAPVELILCIDHNVELYERCVSEITPTLSQVPWEFRVIQNKFDTRLGGARTSAAQVATGDVLAFLDDDASASSSWLRCLTRPYEDPKVVAVGGAPVARFEIDRPRWFPYECHWIFGCAYRGMPEHLAPIDHLIGANMSIRREALMSWGGFQSDNHDDMDLSHRTIHAYGASALLFEPNAVVHHFVPKSRLTWNYFWRRCFYVNRGKVQAFRDMGQASNLNAELRFASRSLSRAFVTEGKELSRGDLYAPVRYLALVTALALGGAGAVAGRLR